MAASNASARQQQSPEEAVLDSEMQKWQDKSHSDKHRAVRELLKKEQEHARLLDAVQGLTAENQRLGAENAALEHSLQQTTADSVGHAQRVQTLSVALTEANKQLQAYEAYEAGVDPQDAASATNMSSTCALGLNPRSASRAQLEEGLIVLQQCVHLLEAQLGQKALRLFGQHGRNAGDMAAINPPAKANLQERQAQDRIAWQSKSVDQQRETFEDLRTRYNDLRVQSREDRIQIADLQAQLKAVQQTLGAAKFQLSQYEELNGPPVEKCEIAGEEKVNGLLADLVAELKRTPQKVKDREAREKTVKAQVKKLTKLYAELRARLDKSHHVQHGVPTQPMQAAAMHGDSANAEHIALLDSTTWEKYSVKDLRRALVKYRCSQQQAEEAVQRSELQLSEALEKLKELAPLQEDFEAAVKEGRNEDFEKRLQDELNKILHSENVKLEEARADLLSLKGVPEMLAMTRKELDMAKESLAAAHATNLRLESERDNDKAERDKAKAKGDKAKAKAIALVKERSDNDTAVLLKKIGDLEAELAEVKAHAAQQTQQKISEAEGLHAVAATQKDVTEVTPTDTATQTEVTCLDAETQTRRRTQNCWQMLALKAGFRQWQRALGQVYGVRVANSECHDIIASFQRDHINMQKAIADYKAKNAMLRQEKAVEIEALRQEKAVEIEALQGDLQRELHTYQQELYGTQQALYNTKQDYARMLARHSALYTSYQHQAQLEEHYTNAQYTALLEQMQQLGGRMHAFDAPRAPDDASP